MDAQAARGDSRDKRSFLCRAACRGKAEHRQRRHRVPDRGSLRCTLRGRGGGRRRFRGLAGAARATLATGASSGVFCDGHCICPAARCRLALKILTAASQVAELCPCRATGIRATRSSMFSLAATTWPNRLLHGILAGVCRHDGVLATAAGSIQRRQEKRQRRQPADGLRENLLSQL